MRQHLYRYLMVTLGCVLMGIAINAFYMPNKLISGGIGGVSVILYYLIGLPMGITSLLLNIPLFVAAYKFMDRSYIVSTLYGMLVFSVSLDAFHFLAEKAPYVHDPMLACIAGGVIYGIGAAMMYRVGGSSGGTDIIGSDYQQTLQYQHWYYRLYVQYYFNVYRRFLLWFRGSALYSACLLRYV